MRRFVHPFGPATWAGVAIAICSLASRADAESFALESARGVVTVRQPAIAPDGSRIAYVRSRQDFKTNVSHAELALIDVTGGMPRTLTRERDGVSGPRWAPAGDRIAFTAIPAKGKPPQLYVLRMDGGDAQKITSVPGGVGDFAWRPDGSGFVFGSLDERPDAKAAEKHNDVFEVTDEHFLTREPSMPVQLWTVDADGNGAKKLTSGKASLPREGSASMTFAPDGTTLAYMQQPDGVFAHFTKSSVVVRNLTTGAESSPLAGKPASVVVYSPDGTLMAVQEPRHGSVYLQSDVVVRDAATGAVKADAKSVDRNVHWFAFADGGKSLAIATPDGVRNVLWTIPVTGGAARKVDLGDVDFGPDASVSAKTGAIAFVGQSPSRPPEIYVLPQIGKPPVRLSDENATFAKAYTWGKSERIDWKTDDGMDACGVLTYPPDYVARKQYPLVLVIHGGPVSTSTQNWSLQAQAMAAHGFLVFQPNYRGSDDMGDAYLQAIVGHVTSGPARDNMLGLAAVEKLGIVDQKRMGVSGWSGGGLQTSWIVGHTNVFKAAVSGAAVNDWYEQAVLADINEEFAQTFIPGVSPFTPSGRAAYRAESPITFANDVVTPTLILSDTGDQRVPITQSYAFYHALKARGTHVEFEAWPRAGHFPTDPVGRESVYRAWMGWFDRWLK